MQRTREPQLGKERSPKKSCQRKVTRPRPPRTCHARPMSLQSCFICKPVCTPPRFPRGESVEKKKIVKADSGNAFVALDVLGGHTPPSEERHSFPRRPHSEKFGGGSYLLWPTQLTNFHNPNFLKKDRQSFAAPVPQKISKQQPRPPLRQIAPPLHSATERAFLFQSHRTWPKRTGVLGLTAPAGARKKPG